MNNEQKYLITDFSNLADHKWQIVNDGVMGGLSQSHFQIQANGHGVFLGDVSLENNGGFASVKNVQSLNLYGYSGISITHKGDGKRYSFRFRTQGQSGLNRWVYEHRFDTESGEHVITHLPFSQFKAVFRGRDVPDAPPPDLQNIKEFGFLISNSQAGNFRLEIAEILAVQ
ncbi:MAG: CIA30 family protein [Balneolaceae bacterium]|nr:MAG: CIA30 family protein [Balneolaceae bacterium]